MPNVTLPKITDYFSNATGPPIDFLRIFVDAWIYFLGSMFWGALFTVIGVALYMKSQNAYVTVAYFVVVISVSSILFPLDLVYLIGLIGGIAIGFLLYQLFVSKKGV